MAEKQRPLDERHEPAPPTYNDSLGELIVNDEDVNTSATVGGDGRINIRINEKTHRFSALFAPAILEHLREAENEVANEEAAPAYSETWIPPAELEASPADLPSLPSPPAMNVVIHVVGSRGDVQPFVAIGQVLKNKWNHRVRVATHPNFKGFVEENGLEFFSIGGDPSKLMAFMVKHPGLLPGIDAVLHGDVKERRKDTYEMLEGCWRSCIEATEDSTISNKPFVADIIIANPPSFAHIHCAEKLGIPVHIMFTMPWSPTQYFSHPLANIQSSNLEPGVINFLSYPVVEMMIWQGLGDVINRFRAKVLRLDDISSTSGSRLLSKAQIPHTYCWSPALIPKPKDWKQHISVAGFFFLPLAQSYTPDPELARFLHEGPPPVYIGFGSIVVDDPDAMTQVIFEAIAMTGQRALVSKGWGGIGEGNVPDNVFMLGNVPHDWLFQHVSCVVHHGGAGTTAAGIAAGKPTVIVPFFGDQPFWGNMVANAGAGPKPIPKAKLTATRLSEAIKFAIQPSVMERAQSLSQQISEERGTDTGANCFHDKLGADIFRCALSPQNTAIWKLKKRDIHISALAAAVLMNHRYIEPSDVKVIKHKVYDLEGGPVDPITAGLSISMAAISTVSQAVFADVPHEIRKRLRANAESQQAETAQAGPSKTSIPQRQTPNQSQLSVPSPSLLGSATAARRSESSLPIRSPSQASQFQIRRKPVASSQISIHSNSSSDSDMTVSVNDHFLDDSKSELASASSMDLTDTASMNESVASSSSSSGWKTSGSVMRGAGVGASKSVGRLIGYSVKAPFDAFSSLSRGFHNAPKLYGDDTVRKQTKITGLGTGLKAAGKEFGLGWYDGLSGIFTQPVVGAKKDGTIGFTTGFLKGVLGSAMKPAAGTLGIVGLTYEGISKEFQKLGRRNIKDHVRVARLAQGFDELNKSTDEQQAKILEKWQAFEFENSKEGKKQRKQEEKAAKKLEKQKAREQD